MSEGPRTYFWDFFGPRSQPTAAHFKRHLRGFLDQHSIGVGVGVGEAQLIEESQAPGHHAVGLTIAAPHRELIEKALRPKRHT